jgi:hypothetical protein
MTETQVPISEKAAQLSGLEKLLLLVPTIAGLFFGLAPLLEAKLFAQVTGYVGADNDIFIYWLAGAATLGYGQVLAAGLREGAWVGMRLLVVAVLAFNACSLFACEEEIRLGRASAHPIVYLILGSSVVFCLISGFVLSRHRGAPRGAPDTAHWVTIFLVIAVIGALATGLLALLLPEQFKPLFGLNAQDVFVYRQLGAATVGYGVMGVLQIRSHRWAEMRLSFIMAGIFNALACIIGITSLVTGKPFLLPTTLVIIPFCLAVGCFMAVARKGK